MTTTAPTAPMDAGRGSRLHGLDTLRSGALGLGILLHALMPFLPGGGWLVVDSKSNFAALAGVYGIHLFRMVLFMLLAGYFGRMVLHRRGVGAYVKDRAFRIGLPVIAFYPLAVLPLGLLMVVNVALRGAALPEDPRSAPAWIPDVFLAFSPGHLWFLVVLLQCVLITVILRAVGLRLLGRDQAGRTAQGVGRVLSSPVGVVVLAVPYLIGLLLQGDVQAGITEPLTILPEPAPLFAYLSAFLAGWFLHALPGSLQRITAQWPVQLAAAVLLTVAGWLLFDIPVPPAVHGGVMALAGWAWTFALIGLCLRFLSRESRVVRYLADASYWSYLMHLPIVLGLGILFADLDWPIMVKLILTCAITAAILLLSYDLLVRSTWIGKWLNGRQHPRALFSTVAPPRLDESRGAGRNTAATVEVGQGESPDRREDAPS
ncbi:MAG: acyltransferase family protein [Propionibacteriaceae bacterium]